MTVAGQGCHFGSRMIAIMAPHRLRPRRALQDQANGLSGWRWWIIRHTPTVLIDYLFEVLMAIMGVVVCAAYFAHVNASSAAVELIPPWLAALYAGACGVGALVIIVGMIVKRYGTAVANGLNLLAIAGAVYVASVIGTVGFDRAVQPIVLAAAFALLCAWRGFILYSTYLVVSESVKRGRAKDGA